MTKLTKLVCEHCTTKNERNRERCDSCNEILGTGYPNVNVYDAPYFRDGLEIRYQKTIEQNKDKQNSINALEQAIKNDSKIAINIEGAVLCNMLNAEAEYLPYRRLAEQKGWIKPVYWDQKRIVIDSCFYGIHGADIVFAALSLDDDGLISYGDATVLLNENLVKKRISVFEKNSFRLYDELTENMKWNPANFPPPTGHYAIWENKELLAVAKCGEQLTGKTTEDLTNFEKLILHSDGNKNIDEFIELHIYKVINHKQYKKVKFRKKPIEKGDVISWEVAKEKMEKENIAITTTWN